MTLKMKVRFDCIYAIELRYGVFDCRGVKDELIPSPEELKTRMSEVILTHQSNISYFQTI
jgi:hypothetical protein